MLTETEKYQACYRNPEYRCGPSRLEIGKRFVDSIDGTYLDVGCGRGELVKHARALGIDAYGLDLVPELCDDRTIFNGTILALPFGSRMFDHVSCLDVLEHLAPEEVPGALDELFRVARSTLFLTTNDHPSVYQGMDLHRTRRPLEWWRGQIERDGWRAEFEFGPPHADWQWTLHAA